MGRNSRLPHSTTVAAPSGERVTSVLLCAFLLVFVSSEIYSEDFDFSTWRGWLELIAPYASVAGLLISPFVAASLWFLAFALVFPLGADPLLLGAYIFPTGITLGLCAYRLPRRWALALCLLTMVMIPLVLLANPRSVGAVAIWETMAVICGAGGLGLNLYRGRLRRSYRDLTNARERQLRIRNEERLRLAHELHDIIAHDVTVIAMQARRGEFLEDRDRLLELLDTIGDSAHNALRDLRGLVALLKTEDTGANEPGGEADGELLPAASGSTTTAAGLTEDAASVTAALRDFGFDVHLDREGSVADVPTSMRQALRRTLREMGTNVLKYGDPHGRVEIALHVQPQVVTLRMSNTVGIEPPVSSSSTGLEAMRTRAEVFGGVLESGRRDDTWATSLRLPLASLEPRRNPRMEGTHGAHLDRR